MKPRTTKRTSFVIRSTLPDEIELFNQRDKVSFSEIIARTTGKHNAFCCPTTSFVNGALLRIQSQEFSEGVPKFLVCIEETLNFDCYHMGIKINIPCIAKNRITTLTWSALEEVVRSLNSYVPTRHVQVLHEQMGVMSAKATNKKNKVYTPDVLVRAFSYYAKSRALYHQLREDFKHPSVRTLQKRTSKCAKQSKTAFMSNVFAPLHEKRKICVLLHDEIYIKKC